jgi:hypothetical protein
VRAGQAGPGPMARAVTGIQREASAEGMAGSQDPGGREGRSCRAGSFGRSTLCKAIGGRRYKLGA